MRVLDLHPWQVTAAEARVIQEDLRQRTSLRDHAALANLRYVAGVDNAYARNGARTTAFAVVVVLRYPEMEVMETRYATQLVNFPYVPGLLSFREAPAILAACRQVETEPDVLLFDAHGYAHFRRVGAASHLGLLLDKPSIGCAKSRLVGEYQEPGTAFGDRQPLVDNGELIGYAVRTRPGHAPLFVSPGHQVSFDTAVEIVLACCREGRFLPEPTRLAHRLANAYKRQQKQVK